MEEIISGGTQRRPPWLLISHGERGEKQTFYSLSEKRFYTTSIPQLHDKCVLDKCVLASAYGWLVLADHKTDDCCLWNPSSMETIELPKLHYSSIYNTCVLSKPPTDPDCHILFNTTSKLFQTFCRLGDDEYEIQSLLYENSMFLAAIPFQGMIYGLRRPDLQFVTVHFNFCEGTLDLTPILTKEGEPWELSCPSPPWVTVVEHYLIESSCGTEVLLVEQMMSSVSDESAFKVFRVDFNRKEFVELDDIGNQAILLSFCGGGTCCSSQGIEPNCIYYTVKDSRNIYIYDLNDQSTLLLLPCPAARRSQSKTYWVEPQVFQKETRSR